MELPARRRIFQAIVDRPGIHFRDLVARVELAPGTVQHHVQHLEDEGLVQVRKDGGFTRYHPVGRLGPQDQATLDALRREYGRRIIATLVAGPLTTKAIAEQLQKAPSTVSWHLSRLLAAGIVARERQGQEVLYRLMDADRAVHLYTVYRGTFVDRLVDGMLGLFD